MIPDLDWTGFNGEALTEHGLTAPEWRACGRCERTTHVLDLVTVLTQPGTWWCKSCATAYPFPSPFAALFKPEDTD